MTQPEQEGTPHHIDAEADGSDAEQSAEPLGSVAAAVPPSLDRPPYFDEALDDAERLLKYAAEIGVEVDDDVRDAVLRARIHGTADESEETTSRLLTSLTTLAALLAPVTAESLKACVGADRHAVQGYWKWAIGLAAVIVPFSVATFVTSGFSDAIRKDIVTANELAVKIVGQIRPSPAQAPRPGAQPEAPLPPGVSSTEVISELQQFASIIRSVDGRARRLNYFVLKLERDPYAHVRNDPEAVHRTFQLPADLPNNLEAAFDSRIRVHQDVRYFAQSILDDVSFFYGAITACILPVLYALLGTCAYLLRTFEEGWRTKTFIPSIAHSARFLIAGIGGAVVGLFNNFTITEGASIPPLAIAFLVGYSVDVFFSFLDSMLLAFTKAKGKG
jgi:hypothetical protein